MPRPVSRRVAVTLFSVAVAMAVGCTPVTPAGGQGPLAVAFGDVRSDSLLLWLDAPAPGAMHVTFAPVAGSGTSHEFNVNFDATRLPVTRFIDGLLPAREYRVDIGYVSVDGARSDRSVRVTTAPHGYDTAPVRVAFGGDLAGQNACRDARRGYPVFDAIAARRPDLFVALGDMIYADSRCEASGRYGNPQVPGDYPVSLTHADFRAHWRYNLDDPALAHLRSRVGWVATWDDHEVVNDFGPQRDSLPGAPAAGLMPLGLAAFREFNPLPGDADAPLYRALRWGRHLELFILDTRSFRDRNEAPDSASKSLLGAAQRRWLEAGLTGSDATWKVVVSSVPIAIPTGFPADNGRDGWAGEGTDGGYEHELAKLLGTLRDAEVSGLVWISADVHFATGFRYQPFPGSDWGFDEFVVGPLNAGVFPSQSLDTTFNPQRRYLHGPASADAIAGYEEALSWFNFGLFDIAGDGALRVAVIDANGRTVYAETLRP